LPPHRPAVLRFSRMAFSSQLIDHTISHYRIIEKLGGGMGIVYKGEDIRPHRFVALKFLSDEVAKQRKLLPAFNAKRRLLFL